MVRGFGFRPCRIPLVCPTETQYEKEGKDNYLRFFELGYIVRLAPSY